MQVWSSRQKTAAAWTGLTMGGDKARRSNIRCTLEAKLIGSTCELDRAMRRGEGKMEG